MSSKLSKALKKHDTKAKKTSNGFVRPGKTAKTETESKSKKHRDVSSVEKHQEDSSSDEEEESDENESEESDDVDEKGMQRLMDLLGEDELDDIAKLQLGMVNGEEEEEESENENEESGQESDSDEIPEEVDLEDVSSVDEDVVPRQKLLIDNRIALTRIRENIQLDPSFPWTETLAVTYDQAIDVDVNDDLQRELAFYKQALHGANTAKTLAARHNLPFTRPSDFYAEMVKSDAHMERIRQRALDETAGIKRSEEKRREREGKKFGKKVQLEKLKERERSKKEIEERVKGLKRKRKDALDADEFDVELEDAIADRPSKRHAAGGQDGKPKMSREKRDAKYGFGGKVGRRSKQNTRESTDTFAKAGKPAKKGKKPAMKRLGKSRRMKTGRR
ncbi:SubName: Full=Related to EBP2-required for pre-rRNA processing and ribosomal subunit assembly {ECO:0000313/EMBL:CCA70824.1} [Serendipita indica DSM 11827]|nr:SubName: Full=Related to EBP2-required for pre-rRNA processing and ribosomal subunit assembly {ECO:0000313/EMBL:CCA70824.1} [Serendipita indica DSM 11827]